MSYYYIDTGSDFSQRLSSHEIKTLSPAQLLQDDETLHRAIKGLIIPCELNSSSDGNPSERNDLYGLKLARELRLNQDRQYPILFVSFLSLEFVKKKSVNASLIEAVGHDFLRLPASGEQIIQRLKEINPLTSTELRDVQWFSCKPDGIINSLVHQLPVVVHKLGNDPGYNAQHAKEELETCIHQIHFVVQSEPDDCLSTFRTHFPEITLANVAEACKFVKTEGEKIILELMKNSTSAEFSEDRKRPWKLLMLDDELDKSSTIIKLLQKKGINVIYRDNAEGAMRALDRDEKHRNKIVLILCDYRLLEKRDGGLFHQKTQGYTFLQQVGKRFQSRILSAVVYSGMPRKFLLETYKTFKMRTEIFSKADFGFDNPEAMNYITNRIAEIGDENYQALTALPLNNTGWEKHLHDWYVYFRAMPDYEQREQDISEYCNQWIEQYRQGKLDNSPLEKGAKMTEFNKVVAKDLKNKNDKEGSFAQSELNKTLPHFISILKTRRIAQFLYLKFIRQFSETETLMMVHKRVKPKDFGASEESRKQLSYTLGLKLSDFPFGANIEELNWLHFDCEIEVLNSYQSFRKKIEETEIVSRDFINQSDYLTQLIKDSKFQIKGKLPENTSLSKSDKNVQKAEYILKFSKDDFRPFLFDHINIGVLIQWISTHVQKNNSSREMKSYLDQFNEKIKKIWYGQKTDKKNPSPIR